jgi:hypothetical protein
MVYGFNTYNYKIIINIRDHIVWSLYFDGYFGAYHNLLWRFINRNKGDMEYGSVLVSNFDYLHGLGIYNESYSGGSNMTQHPQRCYDFHPEKRLCNHYFYLGKDGDGCDASGEVLRLSECARKQVFKYGCASHSSAPSEQEIRKDEREEILNKLMRDWKDYFDSGYAIPINSKVGLKVWVAELRKQGGQE